MVSKLALGGIWAYQRFVSPYKGWRCAYSVLHGGPGCSGHAKQLIRQHGFARAVPLVRQRLRECADALHILRADCVVCNDRTPGEDATLDCIPAFGKRKRREETRREVACDTCNCDGCGACS